MYIAYIIVLITIETIVVVVPALVRTEFLIRPSKEPGSAVKTYSFHSSIVFIKVIKTALNDAMKSTYHSDYYSINRLQTDTNDC